MALADRRVQCSDVLVPKLGGNLAQGLLSYELLQGQVLLAHRPGDGVLTLFDRFVTAFLREPLADLVPRAGAFHESEPVLTRPRIRVLRREDFDDVATVQHGFQRHQPTVDLRTHGAVTDLGVYRIGEVHRSRPTR